MLDEHGKPKKDNNGKLIGAAAVGGAAGGFAAGGLAGKAMGFGKKYAMKKAGEWISLFMDATEWRVVSMCM